MPLGRSLWRAFSSGRRGCYLYNILGNFYAGFRTAGLKDSERSCFTLLTVPMHRGSLYLCLHAANGLLDLYITDRTPVAVAQEHLFSR